MRQAFCRIRARVSGRVPPRVSGRVPRESRAVWARVSGRVGSEKRESQAVWARVSGRVAVLSPPFDYTRLRRSRHLVDREQLAVDS